MNLSFFSIYLLVSLIFPNSLGLRIGFHSHNAIKSTTTTHNPLTSSPSLSDKCLKIFRDCRSSCFLFSCSKCYSQVIGCAFDERFPSLNKHKLFASVKVSPAVKNEFVKNGNTSVNGLDAAASNLTLNGGLFAFMFTNISGLTGLPTLNSSEQMNISTTEGSGITNAINSPRNGLKITSDLLIQGSRVTDTSGPHSESGFTTAIIKTSEGTDFTNTIVQTMDEAITNTIANERQGNLFTSTQRISVEGFTFTSNLFQ